MLLTDPSLARALAYRNQHVIDRFREQWAVSADAGAELFTETKRLLWVKHISESRGHSFGIDPALRILDEMWHVFVLHTREYSAYCQRVYGRYLHHAPTDKAREVARLRRNPEAFAQAERERCLRQWRLVTEVAGEPTLLKWYVDLPLRFGPEFFRTAAVPVEMSYRPPETLVRRLAVTAPPRAVAGRRPRAGGGPRRARGSRATGTDRPRSRPAPTR